MARLMLLRHARAGWANAGSRDFDRSLTESGRKEARSIAEAMREYQLIPDVVICSTARRAQETWAMMVDVLDNGALSVTHEESLYNSDAVHYLQVVQQATAARSLMLVGHNPMLEDLALALAGGGDPNLMAALRRGLPTAGLAVIAFDSALDRAQPGSGRLEAFLSPAVPGTTP